MAIVSAAAQPAPVPRAVTALQYLKPRAASGPTSWTTGEYRYDGAGNIFAIGSETFAYDTLSRVVRATVRGPDLTTLQTQSFGYDEYGNLPSTLKLGQTVALPVTAGTNQLSGITYGASGNLQINGAERYGFDAAGMLSTIHVGTDPQPHVIYAYTADDERLFAFDVTSGTTHWTLRGLDNNVLRDFQQQGSAWSVDRDYIYRDGLLLAALKPGGAVEHYSVDHLGTPRLVTDGAGRKIAFHAYWPFGEEWSAGTAQEGSPLKFTGHERDADPSGGSSPLDYMHARYYRAGWGRFLAVDPLKESAEPGRPQSWNRYAYVENHPLNLVDRDGRCPTCAEVMLEEAGAGAAVDYALGMAATVLGLESAKASSTESEDKPTGDEAPAPLDGRPAGEQ